MQKYQAVVLLALVAGNDAIRSQSPRNDKYQASIRGNCTWKNGCIPTEGCAVRRLPKDWPQQTCRLSDKFMLRNKAMYVPVWTGILENKVDALKECGGLRVCARRGMWVARSLGFLLVATNDYAVQNESMPEEQQKKIDASFDSLIPVIEEREAITFIRKEALADPDIKNTLGFYVSLTKDIMVGSYSKKNTAKETIAAMKNGSIKTRVYEHKEVYSEEVRSVDESVSKLEELVCGKECAMEEGSSLVDVQGEGVSHVEGFLGYLLPFIVLIFFFLGIFAIITAAASLMLPAFAPLIILTFVGMIVTIAGGAA